MFLFRLFVKYSSSEMNIIWLVYQNYNSVWYIGNNPALTSGKMSTSVLPGGVRQECMGLQSCNAFLLLLFELKMRLDFIPSLEGHDDYICNLIKMHVILLLALNILSSTDLCVVHRDTFSFVSFFSFSVLQHSLEHFLTTQNEEAILILTFHL